MVLSVDGEVGVMPRGLEVKGKGSGSEVTSCVVVVAGSGSVIGIESLSAPVNINIIEKEHAVTFFQK